MHFKKKLINEDILRAIKNLSWLGLERLVQLSATIFISGMLARYFDPDVFGKWQYANTLLLIFSSVTWVCGAEILVPMIVRAHAQDVAAGKAGETRLGAILGSAFVLRFSVSLTALLLIWLALAAGWLDSTVRAMLAGLVVTMIFREPFGVVGTWLQGHTHSKPALLISICGAVLKTAAVYLLVVEKVPAAHFGWLWGAESAMIAVSLVAYFAYSHNWRLNWRVEPAMVKRLLSAGSVFWIGMVCMYLFLKLDRIVLERYIDYADLGSYSAARQLSENWILLSLLIGQSLAPAFIYRVKGIQNLKQSVVRLTWIAALVMAAGSAILSLSSSFVIHLVFGAKYAAAADVFHWAVWLAVPAVIEVIGNLVLLKYQAKFVLLFKWLLALITAGVANILLFPIMDIYGALIALGCGYGIAIAVNVCYFRFYLLSRRSRSDRRQTANILGSEAADDRT
jgi:PST family polysaccharide transporter